MSDDKPQQAEQSGVPGSSRAASSFRLKNGDLYTIWMHRMKISLACWRYAGKHCQYCQAVHRDGELTSKEKFAKDYKTTIAVSAARASVSPVARALYFIDGLTIKSECLRSLIHHAVGYHKLKRRPCNLQEMNRRVQKIAVSSMKARKQWHLSRSNSRVGNVIIWTSASSQLPRARFTSIATPSRLHSLLFLSSLLHPRGH